jgi:phytol kinase
VNLPLLIHESKGIAIAVLAIVAVFVTAEVWHRSLRPSLETTRKFVHLGTGLICLTFPFLFTTAWSLVALVAVFAPMMAGARALGLFVCITGVKRRSEGGLFFLGAIWLVFWIGSSTAHPEFYGASVLVLAVGDALAALVGERFGRHPYRVEDSRRSFEGSAAFLLSATAILFLSLWLGGGREFGMALLSALYVSAILAVLEAVSLQGSDNLWIPLASMAILLNLVDKTPEFVCGQILYLGIFLLFSVVVLSRQREIGFAARLGIGLLVYGAHAFQGVAWSAPLCLALVLVALGRSAKLRQRGAVGVRPAFLCVAPALCWILGVRYLHLSTTLAFPALAACVCGCLACLWSRTAPGGSMGRLAKALLLSAGFVGVHSLLDSSASPAKEWIVVSVAAWVTDVVAERLRPGIPLDAIKLKALALSQALVGLSVWEIWQLLVR